MRVAIYSRVSSDEQARDGYSLADQRRVCRVRAELLGATDVVEFADEGVSGSVLERPGLTALRQRARDGGVDAVIISDPDRFARHLAHQLLVTEELDRAGVRLEFVNVEFQQSPEGRLFFALRGAVSEYEREKIRERTTAGRRQKARQGLLPFAVEPYGYRYDSARAMLVIHEPEAAVVRGIFDDLALHHQGLNGIAHRLTTEGVPTRRGARVWHRQVVRQIARNSVYAGTYWANRRDMTGSSMNRHRAPGEKVWGTVRDAADWIPVTVPAIVSQSMWDAAQAAMDRRADTWRQVSRSSYLLSGFVRCSRCGNRMTGRRSVDWGRPRRTYTCRKSTAGARTPGCGLTLSADALETAVWEHVVDTVGQPTRLADLLASDDTAGGLAEELERASATLTRIQRAQDALLGALESGVVSLDAVSPRLERLTRQEAAARQHHDQMRRDYDRARRHHASRAELVLQAQRYIEILDRAFSFEQRRALVRELVAYLLVSPDTVTVGLRVLIPATTDPLPVSVPLASEKRL